METWSTDELLRAAVRRFAAEIPGFTMPAAYGVGRVDDADVVLGHVNQVGAVRPLPAVVLASVCGYLSTTGTFTLTREQFENAVLRLTPAEAATHMPHPNLWTWRTLLAEAHPGSTFHAYFLAHASERLHGPGASEFEHRAHSES